jgi:hypothetical protein
VACFRVVPLNFAIEVDEITETLSQKCALTFSRFEPDTSRKLQARDAPYCRMPYGGHCPLPCSDIGLGTRYHRNHHAK